MGVFILSKYLETKKKSMAWNISKKKTLQELESTYVAEAANISCLLALVKTPRAELNNRVNIMIRTILRPLCFETLNSTAVGAIRSTTDIIVKTSRTNVSIRCLEYKRT